MLILPTPAPLTTPHALNPTPTTPEHYATRRTGLALLDARPALGAVGGVFRGTEPTSVLEQLQHNEYER